MELWRSVALTRYGDTEMAPRKLSLREAKQTVAALRKVGGSSFDAAPLLGLSDSGVRTRISKIRKEFPDLKIPDAPIGGREKAAPPTLDEHVARERHAESERFSNARMKDAARRIAELEDRIRDLTWANNVRLTPSEWTFKTYANRKREHIPELFTSDFQAGEVIRATETEAGYGYSPTLFIKRYRRMIDTANYLAHHHGGSGWTYPGIFYLRGGDTIDGSIHPDDAGEQTMTPLECVEMVAEEESGGIEKLAEAFGKVQVVTPGSAGNHDRTNKKPVSKKAFAHSYDRLIHKMLVNHFRRDARVSFLTSESFDVRYRIYEQNVLLTHGDRMGGGGGNGFIGPVNTILKGWQKVIQEQARLGHVIHQIRTGHYHTPFWTFRGWANGCLPGYSEFAKSNRMDPTPPTQLFGFHHHKRGLVDMKPLVLTETD